MTHTHKLKKMHRSHESTVSNIFGLPFRENLYQVHCLHLDLRLSIVIYMHVTVVQCWFSQYCTNGHNNGMNDIGRFLFQLVRAHIQF